MVGVDGYRITHGTYLNNVEYGPFPMCSKNGVIAHNTAVGHNGAGIPVANDVGTVIEHNLAMQNLVGINVENSSQTVVRHNVTSDNTAGIVVVVLPGQPMPFTVDVQIERNVAAMNNRPNPVSVDSGEPLGAIPTGTGILVVGADRVSIDNNTVTNNDSIGVGIVSNIFCFGDNRIEPFVDDIEVRNNVILGNGGSPDPERAIIPGVDIGFIPNVIDPTCNIAADPGPTDNCFSDNVFDTDFPPGIVALFQC